MRTTIKDWSGNKGFLVNGDPAPCMVIRCWSETVKGRCLCAEHELLFIAVTGKLSPECLTEAAWNQFNRSAKSWMPQRFINKTDYRNGR